MRRYNSTTSRIERAQQITEKHYEVGNQSKCYRAVWRKYIEPQLGICYRTYLNYLNVPRNRNGRTLQNDRNGAN